MTEIIDTTHFDPEIKRRIEDELDPSKMTNIEYLHAVAKIVGERITIERCAQVADVIEAFSPEAVRVKRAIAAAIRKLKDET